MMRLGIVLLLLLAFMFVPLSCQHTEYKVGSKKFTESVILGDMLTLIARENDVAATHFRELGGTQVLFAALQNGDIDIYPEYTGTLIQEILSNEDIKTDDDLSAALAHKGIRTSKPLGFNNTYALGMKKNRAEELDIRSISDLVKHPELNFGFGNEFLDREDGWKNLKIAYGLPQKNVKGLDHDLAYRQLDLNAIDVMDVYTTDAKIAEYDIQLLEDDRRFFPRYDAVLIYRTEMAQHRPELLKAMLQLEGAIPANAMVKLNARSVIESVPETIIAADFLKSQFDLQLEVEEETRMLRLTKYTLQHIDLVRKSLIPAILIAIPIGILAWKFPGIGHGILAAVGIIQTIPSLALLVMLMPLMANLGLASIGLGSPTAITALFLYSLLPIVRNTHSGMSSIPGAYQESASALGLTPLYMLTRIQLPLASQSILAGIKTAAVINVGFATLGALIGAGGYGQPILTGIRLNNTGLILEGAIPAAVLALLVQGAFDFSERIFVPKGLQLQKNQ